MNAKFKIELSEQDLGRLIDGVQQLREYTRQALKGMGHPDEAEAIREVEEELKFWDYMDLNLQEQKQEQQ